ncbi:MAG: DUF885 domain-containing protein [Actinomycetaceae bacterium]|nr:DUF885 domain-containing protein [Actinomycetaceae bacterium]MDY6083611.1 DUF885 domain-containing protein [Actinomycetaceae bacterium]
MTASLSDIDRLANSYFHQRLALNPEEATSVGAPDADPGTWSDYSPEGCAAYTALAQETLTKLGTLKEQSPADSVTAAALKERLELDVELAHAGETVGVINVIESPLQTIRDTFDMMPRATAQDWDAIARRLASVHHAFAGYQQSLRARLQGGPVIPARQVEQCIQQAERVADPGTSPLSALAEQAASFSLDSGVVVGTATVEAQHAFGEFAQFLRTEIAAHTTSTDAVGRERYARFSRLFLGSTIDLDETYQWGLDELAKIDAAQRRIAQQLYGDGVSVREALDRLNADPQYTIHGLDSLRTWMAQTASQALEAMNGAYFDIPAPMQRIDTNVVANGTGGIYYTAPTQGFTRPGAMWWSVPAGSEDFHVWQERTTVFHEGVPGHHLQLGLAVYLDDELNDWRRMGSWMSGHGEGWALYAEQLMAELGFHTDPASMMGVLDSMRLRAARVVVDLGVHLGKDAGTWGDGAWDHDSAWTFLRHNVAMDPAFLSFELDRYLGWPGQAPSYKIGQRMWNDMRNDARHRAEARGQDFDLKAWHMKALSLGSLGLDVLRQALEEDDETADHNPTAPKVA